MGAEMEEEARAERRREVGWRVHEAGGWHRGKGSWGPSPVSLAPVPASEGKRAGGAPSSLSPADLSAASQKSCREPIHLLPPAPSPSQESLARGCHHPSTAHPALQALAPCPGVTAGEELLVAQGASIPLSPGPSEREEILLFSCKDK